VTGLAFFIFGVVFGSFISFLSYRIIVSDSITEKDSKCPKCLHKLCWKDLVPLLSYVFLLGRCRYCKFKISPVYPILEFVTGCLFLFSHLYFHSLALQITMCIVLFILVLCSVIDIEIYAVPDFLLYILFAISIIYVFTLSKDGFMSIVYSFSIFLLLLSLAKIVSTIKKTESLGLGDIILIPILSNFIKFEKLPIFIILVGIFGIVFSIFWSKVLKKGEQFPYIPSISIAFLFCI
jgi:prepilin signal peptidase PulO-like enzyme (type II secretory pathway)